MTHDRLTTEELDAIESLAVPIQLHHAPRLIAQARRAVEWQRDHEAMEVLRSEIHPDIVQRLNVGGLGVREWGCWQVGEMIPQAINGRRDADPATAILNWAAKRKATT